MKTGKMTVFRPCIDLHNGVVKQIVGATLKDDNATDKKEKEDECEELKTNFEANKPVEYYANMFRKDGLEGGHVIMLGKGNEESAKKALKTWPKGFQIGGGINKDNAKKWIDFGANQVIVTSYLFPNGIFNQDRLIDLVDIIGKNKLVIDLSCKKSSTDNKYYVAMNKWTTITEFEINEHNLRLLENYCSEFLIHACDVEGLCKGIDEDLIVLLSKIITIPCTYAGGADSLDTLIRVSQLSNNKIDITYGSCLDIYGGKVSYNQLVKLNNSLKN